MICYIGLGSNLHGPQEQLRSALQRLDNDSNLKLLQHSDFYQSKALTMPGSEAQDDYINAVVQLETFLSAPQLLIKLHEIEAAQGRKRKEKWAARTVDLDILLYGQQTIQSDSLTIPHSQIAKRNFVIHPLLEIAGDIEIPGLGNLEKLACKTSWDGLKKI